MNRQVGEIDELAAAVGILRRHVSEGRQRFFRGIVAGVGRRCGEALAHGGIHRAKADGARGATVAVHLKPLVPLGGQFDREPGFGPDGAANVAVFGHVAFGGNECGGGDLDVVAEGFRGERIAFHGGTGCEQDGLRGAQQGQAD